MRRTTCACCGQVLVVTCRFFGVTAALGLWGVGVEALYYGHKLGYYLVLLAVILTFLESVFLLHYMVELCSCSPSGVGVRVWRGVVWLDDWRKGVGYLASSVPCFVLHTSLPLALVPGSLLVVAGLLYSLKTVKTRRDARREVFLAKTYNRFEEEEEAAQDAEDLEHSIANPTSNISTMSVVDQVEILDL